MAERDLVEQANRAVGGGKLRVQRSVESVESHRHPMNPCAVSPWSGRNERIFDNVQGMQRSLAVCTDVSRELVERASRSGRLGHD